MKEMQKVTPVNDEGSFHATINAMSDEERFIAAEKIVGFVFDYFRPPI